MKNLEEFLDDVKEKGLYRERRRAREAVVQCGSGGRAVKQRAKENAQTWGQQRWKSMDKLE